MIPGHPLLSPLEHVPLGRAATGPPACERPYRACVRARARANLGHPFALDPCCLYSAKRCNEASSTLVGRGIGDEARLKEYAYSGSFGNESQILV